MPDQGYLLIVDITGYTMFLTRSELDHAEDIVHNLMQLLLEETKPPLTIAKLEGDAVFSYAPSNGYSSGQTLLETIEACYIAFRRELDLMRINTTCTCRACSNIRTLDLKFFVHFGEFSVQQIGGRLELTGSDVILVHRLLKNHVVEEHDMRAYALITRTAADALMLGEIVESMVPHSETYENFGEIQAYLDDLQAVWEANQATNRVEVSPDDALFGWEDTAPFPPAVVWEYLTSPQHMLRWMTDLKSMTQSGLVNGRVGQGTVYHCAHGNSTVNLYIVGWYPFDSFTRDMPLPFLNLSLYVTTRLQPTDSGTTITALAAWAPGLNALQRALGGFMMSLMKKNIIADNQAMFARMVELMQEDVQSGALSVPAPVCVVDGEIRVSAGDVISDLRG